MGFWMGVGGQGGVGGGEGMRALFSWTWPERVLCYMCGRWVSLSRKRPGVVDILFYRQPALSCLRAQARVHIRKHARTHPRTHVHTHTHTHTHAHTHTLERETETETETD